MYGVNVEERTLAYGRVGLREDKAVDTGHRHSAWQVDSANTLRAPRWPGSSQPTKVPYTTRVEESANSPSEEPSPSANYFETRSEHLKTSCEYESITTAREPLTNLFLNLAHLSKALSSSEGASNAAILRDQFMSRPQIDLKFLVTALPQNATLPDAIRIHWREYLMEGTELGALMIGICFSGSYIYWQASPLATLSKTVDAFIMGALVAVVTLLIIRSPLGRKTGAHFNPALTFTYFCLGFIHRWDAMFYILFQFVGGLGGVLMAELILGKRLSMPPVCFLITIPGMHGTAAAFIAIFLFAGIMMGALLFATNRLRFVNSTPVMMAILTIFFYGFSPGLSGFSVNPARSFSSALFAFLWDGLWIYFLAPCCGMLAAAFLYLKWPGNRRIYCAKVFHDSTSSCPFYCDFTDLMRQEEHRGDSVSQEGKNGV